MSLKLTVSEVQEWPRASVVGQSKIPSMRPYVLWNHTASFHHALESCTNDDIPLNDETAKISIGVRSIPPDASKFKYCRTTRSVENNRQEIQRIVSEKVVDSGHGHGDHLPRHLTYAASNVTWSLLTFCDEIDNFCGYVYSHSNVCTML